MMSQRERGVEVVGEEVGSSGPVEGRGQRRAGVGAGPSTVGGASLAVSTAKRFRSTAV